MEKEQYEIMYNIEESNWWYKGMRRILFNLLDKYLINENKNNKILDVGCGTGINLVQLKRYGHVEGIDISDEAIRLAKKRNVAIEKADAEKLPFQDNTFDLVTSFEVIYHQQVKDDIKALREIHRVLKKGGIAVIRVPAFKWLQSQHDAAVHTQRRYSRKELEIKVKKAGLKIRRMSYLNMLLFPAILPYRIMKRPCKELKSDLESTPKSLNSLLTGILYLESALIRYINLPFGVSLICVAEKP